jgi:predicted ATP-dependent endonuclease of OLD family
MLLKRISISNFRSIADLEVDFERFTALMGANNCGKSTVMNAIELFFDAAPKLTLEDYFNKQESLNIQITATFGELTPLEREEFSGAVRDGELAVSREFGINSEHNGVYSVFAKVNPDFKSVREETNGTKRRSFYAELRKRYPDLRAAQSADAIEPELRRWELENDGATSFEKVRGFFGAINVANGKLKRKTFVQLIPAVKEASQEFGDPRRSPVMMLLSNITRQTFENRADVQTFIDEMRTQFEKLTNPESVPQLRDISKNLTEIVQNFYSDTELLAGWSDDEQIQVSYPTPEISIKHRDLDVNISSVGHGLQRALVFTVVQYLAEQQSTNENVDASEVSEYKEPYSDIILLIEEPEIYQHPIKQMVIYRALKQLAAGFNKSTGIRLQIIFSTHSEKFIEMKDFNHARLVRKKRTSGAYDTECRSYSLSDCSRDLAALLDPPKAPMSDEALGAKLHIFSREMSEGFFADCVVLVEGDTDAAILDAAYRARGKDMHSEGKSVIAVGGKTKLDKPYLIFSKLGIPVFLVFDNDQKKAIGADTNRRLQKLCGVTEPEDWPKGVFEKFAAFEGNLEEYLRSVLGEEIDKYLEAVANEWGLSPAEIIKTPAALASLFTQATAAKHKFPIIDEIMDGIERISR